MNGVMLLWCYIAFREKFSKTFICVSRRDKATVVFCDITGAKTMLQILMISIKNL